VKISPAKRRVLLLALGACTLAVVAAVAFWPEPKEPEYQGKKLSEWLNEYSARPDEARSAVMTIGKDAVPFLVKWVDNQAGYVAASRARLGFEILGTNAATAIPELSRILVSSPPNPTDSWPAHSLAFLGKDALAPLLSILGDKSQNPLKRLRVASAVRYMAYLGSDAAPAIPVLIGCLSDPNQAISDMARQTLENFARDPVWVPKPGYGQPLSTGAPPTDPALRCCVVKALEGFGTNAMKGSMIWATIVVRGALEDSDASVRAAATNAFQNAFQKIAPGVLGTNGARGDPHF